MNEAAFYLIRLTKDRRLYFKCQQDGGESRRKRSDVLQDKERLRRRRMGSHLPHRWNLAGRGYSPSTLPPFRPPLLVSTTSLRVFVPVGVCVWVEVRYRKTNWKNGGGIK